MQRAMAVLGKAVQVDPIKPMLKPPGTKHLILRCDILLSNFAFKFDLRRYSWAAMTALARTLRRQRRRRQRQQRRRKPRLLPAASVTSAGVGAGSVGSPRATERR